MLCYAVLAILLLQYVNASSCPSGYDIQAFNSCYKAYTSMNNRSQASFQCSKDGGRLASIHNAFTNALILDLANYVGAPYLWIGLICPDENTKNCVWDDGEIGADSYSAFVSSYPSANSDNHWVCMMITNGAVPGNWEGFKNNARFGYVCEVSTRDLANITDLARNSRQH